MNWVPKRSIAETERLLCAPGNMHEVETRVVNGRFQRVYKNLHSSVREFWLDSVEKYSEKTYIVFENQRLTYGEVHSQAVKVASVFRNVYGVSKGDRVAICSRNCPEFLVVYWACQLLGAISVQANAWLPFEPLLYCLVNTKCKVIMLDSDRAKLFSAAVTTLTETAGAVGILVFDNNSDETWRGIRSYRAVMDNYSGESTSVLKTNLLILPEDDSTIMFTSGTTGLPKGVLSTQRQFLTNAFNTIVGGLRASLRRGETIICPSDDAPQAGALIAVPLFHVTGLTSYTIMSTMLGMKIVLMQKWIPEEAVRLIKTENVGVAGGVPAMVSDLVDSSLAGFPLKGLFFGGSPAPETLVSNCLKTFPGASLSQGYGLTETNSIAVTIAGEDYIARPKSTGLPSPVNDVVIMNGDKCAPPGAVGEVWLRGPNIMTGYWNDPDATSKVLNADGWLKSGDIGLLDQEGFLYIKDRIKDIIIRGGENIDSVTVENALYSDPRVMEAAAVGVPDPRLGELVAAVVTVKSAYRGTVSETSLMASVQRRLPRYAVPVMIIIRDTPFELTPSRKIMKGKLKKLAGEAWAKRKQNRSHERLANL